MTPGIQPQHVNRKTISIEPQPLSNTANGGNIIDKKTLNNDMTIRFFYFANIIKDKRRMPKRGKIFCLFELISVASL